MTNTVTDRYTEVKESFLKLFENQADVLNGQKDHRFHQLRRKAIERLQHLEFPTRRDEDWKYTSVNQLLQLQYQEAPLVNISKAQLKDYQFEGLDIYPLVFVNGHFQKALSASGADFPEGVIVEEMADALSREDTDNAASEFLLHWSSEESNPFVVLNAALARHGLFIHVPANVTVDKPIHIIHLAAPGQEPFILNPQLVVSAAVSSDLTIIEGQYCLPGKEGPYFTNLVNRFQVGANARVRHFKLQNEGKEAFQITSMEASQERDSTFTSHVLDLGGSLVRNNISSVLKGENTSTNYYGVYLAKGRQHMDTQTFIDHAMPHCVSNELYKGVLSDRAKGVFNGKVIVRQDAQKTNAFQQNSSLVLSPYANMDSKPQLEIFADDVRCSHGATIGQLDEDSVYYLRSRGLTDEQARSMLQHAFLQEVIEHMRIDQVQAKAEKMIHAKFEEQLEGTY